MSLLKVQNFSCGFRGEKSPPYFINKMNFEVNRKDILAIVGESGSGKSLLSKSILDIYNDHPLYQKKGKILFNNRNIFDFNNEELRDFRGKEISMIFQDPMNSLNPLHKIGKQIKEIVRFHQLDKEINEIDLWMKDLLSDVGFYASEIQTSILNSYPHQISGGQKQRVMIAMMIACQPQLLIADEPTTSLDHNVVSSILELLKDLRDKRGMSIIFITHDLGLVKMIADRVLVMDKGNIIEHGKAHDIFHNPQHDNTKKLMSNINLNLSLTKAIKDNVLLSVRDVRVYYTESQYIPFKKAKKNILNSVSFDLPARSTLGIIGASGVGKTSIANAIMGYVKYQGTILFDSIDIQKYPKTAKYHRGRVQMLFQNSFSSLNPRMNVESVLYESISCRQKYLGINKKFVNIEDEIDRLLDSVDLSIDFRKKYPTEMSGGECQRIALCRTFSLLPKVVILDEPTSSLDVTNQANILKIITRLQHDYGVSYILISHDFSVINAMSHQVIKISS